MKTVTCSCINEGIRFNNFCNSIISLKQAIMVKRLIDPFSLIHHKHQGNLKNSSINKAACINTKPTRSTKYMLLGQKQLT